MAELPIMPVATDALIADTQHLNPDEFGVYVRILVAMWRNRGWLPHDENKLATIGGVGRKRWLKIRETILVLFTVHGGRVTQKKLLQMYASALTSRDQRSVASKRRWDQAKQLNLLKSDHAAAYAGSIRPDMRNPMQNGLAAYATKEERITTTSLEAARGSPVDSEHSEQKDQKSEIGPATALPSGAPALSPEAVAPKVAANGKPATIPITPALEAVMARKLRYEAIATGQQEAAE